MKATFKSRSLKLIQKSNENTRLIRLILICSTIQVATDGCMSMRAKQNVSIWKNGRIVEPKNYIYRLQVISDGNKCREILQTPFRH